MRPADGWPDEGRWYAASDLRRPRGYVVVRATGEVLSSVVADVCRERKQRADTASPPDRDSGLGGVR